MNPPKDHEELAYLERCIREPRPYFGPLALTTPAPFTTQLHLELAARILCLAVDRPVSILEIGSWGGASAVTLATSLEKYNGGRGSLLCIDPWEHPVRPEIEPGTILDDRGRDVATYTVEDFFRHNVESVGAAAQVTAVRGYSHDLIDRLGDSQFDLVLVDGDHRYEGARRDFRTCKRLVRDGGLMCSDDLFYQTSETDLDAGRASFDRHEGGWDPRVGMHFFPGVSYAVQQEFGEIDDYPGFFCVQKVGDGWQCIDLGIRDSGVHLPDYLARYHRQIVERFVREAVVLRETVGALERRARERGWRRIALYGLGELTLRLLAIRDHIGLDREFAAILDADAPFEAYLGVPVLPPDGLADLGLDAIVVPPCEREAERVSEAVVRAGDVAVHALLGEASTNLEALPLFASLRFLSLLRDLPYLDCLTQGPPSGTASG